MPFNETGNAHFDSQNYTLCLFVFFGVEGDNTDGGFTQVFFQWAIAAYKERKQNVEGGWI